MSQFFCVFTLFNYIDYLLNISETDNYYCWSVSKLFALYVLNCCAWGTQNWTFREYFRKKRMLREAGVLRIVLQLTENYKYTGMLSSLWSRMYCGFLLTAVSVKKNYWGTWWRNSSYFLSISFPGMVPLLATI